MLRKILGAVVLVIGGYSFLIGLLLLLPVLVQGPESELLKISSALPFGALFVLGGTALWGWNRRRMVVGVVATTLGGILALVGVVHSLLMLSAEWRGTMVYSLIVGGLLFGSLLLTAGIRLIRSQLARDRQRDLGVPPTATDAA